MTTSSTGSGLSLPAFATQLVGSWCKPQWLADHDQVYGVEGTWWRVPPEHRDEAFDDAVRLAVYDQERAGLSLVTDGEQRRQTFSGHFYAFGGIDSEHQGAVTSFGNDIGEYLTMKKRAVTSDDDGKPKVPPKFEQPRVVAPLTWNGSLLADALRFTKQVTDRPVKVTLIGPASLALRLVDEHYGDLGDLARGVADVLNQEIQALVAAGADVIQLDEPEVHFRYSAVEPFAAEVIDRALRDVRARTTLHMCYGYARNIAEKRETPVYNRALEVLASTVADSISLEYEQPHHGPDLLEHAGTKDVVLGVLNLATDAPVETPEHIVGRARDAVSVVGPRRLSLAPDCGMWFLPRATALAKITAMEHAARTLRDEHG
jgi:5-methyltetrahydropteroyltriglutamate--homocysteine methyltransferase